MMHKNMCRAVVFSACALSFGLIAMDQEGGSKSLSARNSPRNFGSQDSPRKLRNSKLASLIELVAPRLNRSGSLSSVVRQSAVANEMKRTASSGAIVQSKETDDLRVAQKNVIKAICGLTDAQEEEGVDDMYGTSASDDDSNDLAIQPTQAKKDQIVAELHEKTRLRSSKSPRERDEATLAKQKIGEDAEEEASEESTKWTEWMGHRGLWNSEEDASSSETLNEWARYEFVPSRQEHHKQSSNDIN
jgi:hypothetical protein